MVAWFSLVAVEAAGWDDELALAVVVELEEVVVVLVVVLLLAAVACVVAAAAAGLSVSESTAVLMLDWDTVEDCCGAFVALVDAPFDDDDCCCCWCVEPFEAGWIWCADVAEAFTFSYQYFNR